MVPVTSTPLPAHTTLGERTVLGALLLDAERMIEIAPLLSPDDFFDGVHKAIYQVIQRLYEDRVPIDPVMVADALKENKSFEAVGGLAFLLELANNVPTSSHATKYAEIVRSHSLRRRLSA